MRDTTRGLVDGIIVGFVGGVCFLWFLHGCSTASAQQPSYLDVWQQPQAQNQQMMWPWVVDRFGAIRPTRPGMWWPTQKMGRMMAGRRVMWLPTQMQMNSGCPCQRKQGWNQMGRIQYEPGRNIYRREWQGY